MLSTVKISQLYFYQNIFLLNKNLLIFPPLILSSKPTLTVSKIQKYLQNSRDWTVDSTLYIFKNNYTSSAVKKWNFQRWNYKYDITSSKNGEKTGIIFSKYIRNVFFHTRTYVCKFYYFFSRCLQCLHKLFRKWCRSNTTYYSSPPAISWNSYFTISSLSSPCSSFAEDLSVFAV